MSLMEAPSRNGLAPSVSVREDPTSYVIELDVSDFLPSSLRVEVEGDEVTIFGRSFEEVVLLPRDADVEWLSAVYDEGRLELRAPRLGSCSSGRRNVEIVTRQRVLENPDATPC